MSVCEVTEAEAYEIGRPGVPLKYGAGLHAAHRVRSCQPTVGGCRNGVNDLRMGSTTHALRCQTCECSYLDCPGHFGHITLVKPVFEVGMLKKIITVLRCVCHHCGRLLASKARVPASCV
jgi:hypothetical protein